MNEIQPRTRGIDVDEKKLSAQSEIDGKRKRRELIDLANKPPNQSVSKLFNNTLDDFKMQLSGSDYGGAGEAIVNGVTLAAQQRKEDSDDCR